MKLSKKLLSLSLAACMTLSLAACGSSSTSSASASGSSTASGSSSADSAISAKTLRVGMEGTYAPYTYHGDDGKLTGFEVDVANAIGEKMGYKVEFVECDWDSMFEALNNNKFDVIMNQVTITDEREKSYDFSTPYIYTRPVLIVASSNNTIKSFSDIKGLRAAEGLTSNYNAIAQSYGATIVGQDEVAMALQCIITGDADCVINDLLTYSYWTKQTGDTTSLKIAAQSDDVTSSAVVMAKGRDELKGLINNAIEELLKDGTISKISQTYFDTDVSSAN